MEDYVSASVHPEDDEGPSELAFSQNSIKKAGDAFGIPTDNLGSLREANSNPVQQADTTKPTIPARISCSLLKEKLIMDQGVKTKIRPILLAFSGLPQCGKTKAVRHLLEYYIDPNQLKTTMTPKYKRDIHASGISYFELVASGFHRLRHPVITEVTKESSCAFSILSALSKHIEISNGSYLRFEDGPTLSSFDDKDLHDNLHRFFSYLKEKCTSKMPENSMKMLPEGIALINIWELAINKTVLHFLSGLIGHLYNSHMWLFLNIDRDLNELYQPPEIDLQLSNLQDDENAQDLMKWRPRLHYLVRTSRLSKAGPKERESPCTIFAAHRREDDLDKHLKELKSDVQQVAKHVNVASLIDCKLETINLKHISDENSMHLFKKFQQVICETPFEEIPVAWVFLRSSFYFSEKQIISKAKLLDMARECGITDIDKFSKFYMSFGSIFDLNVVDPTYEYVIVKPIGFLRMLDVVLNPKKISFDKYPTLQFGIISEEFCKENLKPHQEHWKAYMDALVVVHLAAEVRSQSIDLPDLDHTKTYYFVPLTRTGEKVVEFDNEALHIITSIDKSHIFKQAFFVKHLFDFFPDAKLICCTEANQTKIKVKASNSLEIIITLVHHSPTTKIHVSSLDHGICTRIIKTCYQMAEKSKIDGGTTSFDFIVLCNRSTKMSGLDAHNIATCYHHVLPMDSAQCSDLCSDCVEKFSEGQLKIWNDIIQKDPIPPQFKRNNSLAAEDIARVAHEISAKSDDMDITSDLAKFFEVDVRKQLEQFGPVSKEHEIMLILLEWSRRYRGGEPAKDLARKLLELNSTENSKHYSCNLEKLARDLSPYVTASEV